MESFTKQNDDIQILRSIAIIFVILVHSIIIIPQDYSHFYFSIKKIFNTGSGVDLFFVMAGFFLSSSLKKINHEQKMNSFLSFMFKKIKRLSPAAYLWSAIPLCMSLIMPNTYWLSVHDMFMKFFSSVFYLRNFEEVRLTSVFGYLWALGLEFQVFAAFSFIYIFIGRRAYYAAACIICFMMIFYRPGGNYSWMFRYDSMLYGIILYYTIVEKECFRGWLKILCQKQNFKPVLAVGLLMLLAASFNIPSDRFNITVLSSLISCLLVTLALYGGGLFEWISTPIHNVMLYIGNRSYSLFCCHIPSWILTLQILQGHVSSPIVMLVAQLSAMLLLSELTYRFVENLLVKNTKRMV